SKTGKRALADWVIGRMPANTHEWVNHYPPGGARYAYRAGHVFERAGSGVIVGFVEAALFDELAQVARIKDSKYNQLSSSILPVRGRGQGSVQTFLTTEG
ncbi:MAG: hypothetical protein R6X17_04525, partial [Candidatus Competibacteraceae bacterium]